MNASAPARPQRPDFHDLALRQALDDVADRIESYRDRLDELSTDIKMLEGYFERSTVRLRACVDLPSEGEDDAREQLCWEKYEPGRWRVTYRRDGFEEDSVRTPLIEAPIDVRHRARAKLAELLRAVAEQVPPAPTSDDDIPF